jgi:DNA-binding NtrC family response regulator
MIYILEDSKIVSELLKFDLVREFYCEVNIFENGNDLLDNIHNTPDVIILDHFIHNEFNENGLMILKRIKEIDTSIPIIIFSGQHNSELTKEFIHSGANVYIDKNKESFLEDIINAVHSIFNNNDSNFQMLNLKKSIGVYKMQVAGLGVFLLLLIFSFFSI